MSPRKILFFVPKKGSNLKYEISQVYAKSQEDEPTDLRITLLNVPYPTNYSCAVT